MRSYRNLSITGPMIPTTQESAKTDAAQAQDGQAATPTCPRSTELLATHGAQRAAPPGLRASHRRQAARALPVLWRDRQQPRAGAVCPGRPSLGVQVAQSAQPTSEFHVGAIHPLSHAVSAPATWSFGLTQPRLGKGWLKRLVREIRRQASVRGRQATRYGRIM